MTRTMENLRKWLSDLLSLSFNERHRGYTIVVISGLLAAILSQTFTPWVQSESYFGNQNLLFQFTVRVNDILAAMEAGINMASINSFDSGLLFIWLVLIGSFFAKMAAYQLTKRYTHSFLSGLVYEECLQSSLFYILTLVSFFFLPPIIHAFTSANWFNEIVALILIILGIFSLIIVIPSALYLIIMSISLFLSYQILNYVENTLGKIITVMIALAVNIILDHFVTLLMLKILEAILDKFDLDLYF